MSRPTLESIVQEFCDKQRNHYELFGELKQIREILELINKWKWAIAYKKGYDETNELLRQVLVAHDKLGMNPYFWDIYAETNS